MFASRYWVRVANDVPTDALEYEELRRSPTANGSWWRALVFCSRAVPTLTVMPADIVQML